MSDSSQMDAKRMTTRGMQEITNLPKPYKVELAPSDKQSNYVHVVEGSERCLNGHPVTDKGITPWGCSEPSCQYYSQSNYQQEIKDILKNVHTMGMSDQLIGVREHYSDEQLSQRAKALTQLLNSAIAEELERLLDEADHLEGLPKDPETYLPSSKIKARLTELKGQDHEQI